MSNETLPYIVSIARRVLFASVASVLNAMFLDVVPIELHPQTRFGGENHISPTIHRIRDSFEVRGWYLIVQVRAQEAALEILAGGFGCSSQDVAIGPVTTVHLALDTKGLTEHDHLVATGDAPIAY